MVAFFSGRTFSVLNGALRTPLKAGKALVAVTPPAGRTFFHHNIGRRTNLFTNPAGMRRIIRRMPAL